MTALRPVLAVLLSLILLLGSVTGVVARVELALGSDVTLCGADGAVTTLRLDAQGNPSPRGHDCPHCLAALATAILPPPPLMPGLAQARSANLLPGLTTALPPAQTLAPLARGPPLSI